MKDDFLILNIAQANTKCPRLANARAQPLKQLFLTLGHRRLHCMREAECVRVRVRVKLSGLIVDGFASKEAEVGAAERDDTQYLRHSSEHSKVCARGCMAQVQLRAVERGSTQSARQGLRTRAG